MQRNQLAAQIRSKKNYLCVGLDTDIQKIPKHFLKLSNPVLAFNKAIIDATKNVCVSYKINTAFYEAMGAAGWEVMEETFAYIPSTHFKIADAKRGDIGNTSHQYARAFFEKMNVDAVTVAPYMGEDSIRPFLEYDGKWAIVLGLTSNKGSADFQQLQLADGKTKLFEKTLEKIAAWGSIDNLMFVTGATQAAEFANIRRIVPNHFLLVPGLGSQGGSLLDVSKYGSNSQCGLLVNASRSIIFASENEDFAKMAFNVANDYHTEMGAYFDEYKMFAVF